MAALALSVALVMSPALHAASASFTRIRALSARGAWTIVVLVVARGA